MTIATLDRDCTSSILVSRSDLVLNVAATVAAERVGDFPRTTVEMARGSARRIVERWGVLHLELRRVRKFCRDS